MRDRGWTKKRRALFLKELALTCNVTAATKASGNTSTNSSAYDLRRRDPAFAQLWEEALAIGYDRLETLLLQRALEGVNAIDMGALVGDEESRPRPIGAVPRDASARSEVQLALALLNRRRDGPLRATKRMLMSSAEVDKLLVKKLDVLARKQAPSGE